MNADTRKGDRWEHKDPRFPGLVVEIERVQYGYGPASNKVDFRQVVFVRIVENPARPATLRRGSRYNKRVLLGSTLVKQYRKQA